MERTVIDEELIKQAVIEDRKPLKLDGSQSKTEGEEFDVFFDEEVNLSEIEILPLSFNNIYRIDNLRGFEKLVKLQLDNNVIEKIENIDHLVNLTWLDLSFNNISKIENLSTLVNLTDLSLFHNQITVIENLDKLIDLNVLSLGNNDIKDVENLMYLRQFKHLRLLNLTGNPVANEDDYQTTVLAYLQHLYYIDYQTIEKPAVIKAKEDKQAQLLELEEIEKLQVQEGLTSAKTLKYRQALQRANLGGIDTFFEEMIAEDMEIGRLQRLPGFNDVLHVFRDRVEKALGEFVEKILSNSDLKSDEVNQFQQAIDTLCRQNETKSLAMIRGFESSKKQALRTFTNGRTEGIPDGTLVAKLTESIQALSDAMMDDEMQCTEEVTDCINEFETGILRIAKQNAEHIGNFARLLEDLERNYWEDLSAMAHGLLEKYNSATADDTIDDALSTVLSEKEGLETAISNSHSNHLEKILKLGDEIADRESKSIERIAADIRTTEYTRNRQRITEIVELVDLATTSVHSGTML